MNLTKLLEGTSYVAMFVPGLNVGILVATLVFAACQIILEP